MIKFKMSSGFIILLFSFLGNLNVKAASCNDNNCKVLNDQYVELTKTIKKYNDIILKAHMLKKS